MNEIYATHNGLPVSRIYPCHLPPRSRFAGQPPPSPHCLITLLSHRHTGRLLHGLGVRVCRHALCPPSPSALLKRRSRSRPGRLALHRQPPFSNQAGKPCANEGGGRGGDRGNEAGRPGQSLAPLYIFGETQFCLTTYALKRPKKKSGSSN